jgi:hypothetical protein
MSALDNGAAEPVMPPSKRRDAMDWTGRLRATIRAFELMIGGLYNNGVVGEQDIAALNYIEDHASDLAERVSAAVEGRQERWRLSLADEP